MRVVPQEYVTPFGKIRYKPLRVGEVFFGNGGIIMSEIVMISGDSGHTYFELGDGKIVVADSELRTDHGASRGVRVFRSTIRFKKGNTKLSPKEKEELLAQYDLYVIRNTIDRRFIDWAE